MKMALIPCIYNVNSSGYALHIAKINSIGHSKQQFIFAYVSKAFEICTIYLAIVDLPIAELLLSVTRYHALPEFESLLVFFQFSVVSFLVF